jgi:hypothetical protein
VNQISDTAKGFQVFVMGGFRVAVVVFDEMQKGIQRLQRRSDVIPTAARERFRRPLERNVDVTVASGSCLRVNG